MYGDFSRNSYEEGSNYTGVLMQQGRLFLDADWNEQHAITLNYVRSLAADVIGWHGGPNVAPGFGIKYTGNETGAFRVAIDANQNITVTGGRYYIDGWLVDWPNSEKRYPAEVLNKDSGLTFRLVFVELHQRHAPAINYASLRDPALFGLDTCERSQLVVRFLVLLLSAEDARKKLPATDEGLRLLFKEIADPLLDPRPLDGKAETLPLLSAEAPGDWQEEQEEHCNNDGSDVGYVGLENQLYRVEIHSRGENGRTFWDGSFNVDNNRNKAFTIKWSRDNGSVVYPATLNTGFVALKTKWKDDSRAIHVGNFIEVLQEDAETGDLVKVTDVRFVNGRTEIVFDPEKIEVPHPEIKDVLVRRWDHSGDSADFPVLTKGGILIRAVAPPNGADETVSVKIPLEDNLYVTLVLPSGAKFRAGDYWQIPARASIANIIWPKNDDGTPRVVPARYAERHYAPLALFSPGDSITPSSDPIPLDLRRAMRSIADPQPKNAPTTPEAGEDASTEETDEEAEDGSLVDDPA